MASKEKVKVDSLRIVSRLDQDPDLSHLGSYNSAPKGKFWIDRKERGDMGRNQLRYFNHGTGDPEYIESDYMRYEAYNNSEWHMRGIYAEATVIINGTVQTIRSGGLWGVESDADKSYVKSIAKEEYDTLCHILRDMGVKRIPPCPDEVESKG